MATKLRLTPTQRFSNFFKVVKIFAMVCGANIFRADYRFNPFTGFVVGVILTFFGFTWYSMYVGVVIDNDFTTILQSLCYTGAAIQGATKLVVSLCQTYTLHVFGTFEHLRGIRVQKRTFYTAFAKHFIIGQASCVHSTGDIFHTNDWCSDGTIVVLFSLGSTYRSIIPLLIPGTDKNSHFGFYIYQFYHICCVCFASFGNFASDSYMVILVVHVPLFKNILKLKFDHLNEILQEYPRDAERTEPLLKEIFQWHRTSIASNDDLTRIIYDCNWYELTVSEQKMILIMLRKSQQAPSMTVGGFMPLSLNTALQLTKSIYTAAMILNEFLN
ncbi:odorant receptor 67d-like [Musca domestica]|uniref:Odorant receptor 67d-like n=1 Tax=Musca domestica TaxID=7370 RepID=A0ABM3VQN5_MUSDO|nr:odorant receptor 67d-like [Musca domestica]